MKKIFILIHCIVFAYIQSQNIHVKYDHVASKIASFHEDLYIKGNSVYSVEDSIMHKPEGFSSDEDEFSFVLKTKIYKKRIVKNVTNNNLKILERLGKTEYLINDSLPKTNWNVDYNTSKKIDKYLCYKATTNFRGSNIIAYFTKEIPYSTGPYKFGGLPGLILEIYEDGKKVNSWKVISIDGHTEIPTIIIPKNIQTVSLQKFLELKKEKDDAFFKKLMAPAEGKAKIEMIKQQRNGIEKKYEWEN
ncbi:TPA: GLPGLI family protein [Elizabethkingia anophelis]|nr:GLPGLI family protein [Elizabethkingia anophelis]